MSWVDLIVERQIAEAMARGELDAAALHGAELDLDTSRRPGWWAEQFVEREKLRLRDEPDAAQQILDEWRADAARAAKRR
jgi:hypothetical protein